MKRAWMKVKAVSTRATNNNGLEGQSDPAQPQTKRRVRTSAAMIGLAISMGTSNLLVTRPSDRTPAAEPTGNEPVVNTIPTDLEVSLGKTKELMVAPAVVKSLPTAAANMLSSRLLPNPQIRLQSAIPDLSSLTRAHQEPAVSPRLAAGQQQQSSQPPITQVDLANIAIPKTAVTSNRSPKLPAFPSANAANRYNNRQKTGAKSTKPINQAQRKNQLQQLKISQTARTVSPSQQINRQEILLPPITTATNLPQAKSVSPQQKALINRLKQQSLKDRLTAWQQQTGTATASTTQAIPASPAVTTAFVIPVIPETAANEPSVVAANVALNYQVKAGDTLTAIAHQYGVALSELVKTNHLPDPNQLRIQQQLKIPVSANSAELQAKQQAIATNPQTSSLPLDLQTNTQAQPQPYSGMGGNISEDETVVPLSSATQSAATKSQLQPNPYIQGLRTDIENLRQKYSAQRAIGQAITPTISSSVAADTATNLSPQTQLPVSQPVNPELLMAQVSNRSKPAAKQQRSLQVSSAPPQPKSNMATAPLGLDAAESLDSLRGQQVSPELPPLGAAANYLPKPNASLKGYIWPARGALTSGYGWRWGRMHKGIDIAAPVGTPVFAAASGVVIKAGWNRGGYGNLVDIQHADGSLTRYAHNNKVLVQAGQQVEQGQQISEMGNSGFSTGPHLHFEVHPLGKKAVDPIAYLPGK